jgi:hypothetical protein
LSRYLISSGTWNCARCSRSRINEDVIGVESVEVVIGFLAGYLVGTRQGRQGMQKALDSAQAIWASPETRKLLGEGLTAFEAVAAPALDRLGTRSSRGSAAVIGNMVNEVMDRRRARAA